MKHKHAELMALYAQDAMETDKPWERWERRYKGHTYWQSLNCCPTWTPITEYRRKPRTININGFEVPEPVREPLKDGQEYYDVSIGSADNVVKYTWRGESWDFHTMDKGIVHLTKEAAMLHAEALLSFTQKTI
jgi:hypothetical protein